MKFVFGIFILFNVQSVLSQDQNVQVSGAVGWSAQNEWDEETRMRSKIKRGYVVSSLLLSFLGPPSQIENPEIRISKNTTPS